MVSRRHSGIEEKTKEPYFGTYHHSTSAASRKTCEVAKAMFIDTFASLPFRRDDELSILDVGCGLRFLSCVSAEFYKNAQITGIDTFKHASLKGSSLEKAKENARILGFSDRIDFKTSNVFRFTPPKKFDIIVSYPMELDDNVENWQYYQLENVLAICLKPTWFNNGVYQLYDVFSIILRLLYFTGSFHMFNHQNCFSSIEFPGRYQSFL